MKGLKLNNKRKLLIGLIFIIYLLISMQTASLGATAEVVYGGSISWNGSTVGKFAVNDQIAFCIDHAKSSPPGGTDVEGSTTSNPDMVKCLYYGWGGYEEWEEFGSEAQGIVQTTLALDYYVNGNPHNAANSFIEYIESMPVPELYLTFSNNNLTATKQGTKQVTNSTTVQGSNGISMTLTLQDDVTIVCENMGWSQTGGSVTISAGDILHFEAPLTVTGNWVSADIVNRNYKFQAVIYNTGSSSYQRLGGSLNMQPDPTSTINLNINWLDVGSFKVIKKNVAGDVIPNTSFHIWNDEGYDETKTTNSSGEIVLEDINPGTYYIKETAVPSGYTVNPNTYNITVNAGDTPDTKNITITNEEPTGTITITKTNTNGDKIPNVQFQIIAKETIKNKAGTKTYYTAGQIVATVTTNVNGEAIKSGLPLGKYTIKETQVPSGYLLNTEQKDVTLSYKDQNTSIVYGTTSFVNEEPTGTLSIKKVDNITNGTANILGEYLHGDVSVAGAVYTLYADEIIKNKSGTINYFNKDEAVANFTFNEKGVATITILKQIGSLRINGNILKGLPLGKYYAKETVTPKGYITDENKYSYSFQYTNSNTAEISISKIIEETIKREPFEIIKVSTITNDTAKLVKDAEFTVILKRYVDFYGSVENALLHTSEFRDDEWGVYTTDERGYIKTKRLAYGIYYVKETVTPEGLNKVKDFIVTISNNSIEPTQNWRVENDIPFTSYIKIIKKDKKTGNNVIFSNATFKIYKYNETTGEYDIEVKCKVGHNYYSSWTTNNEGIAYTETKLEYGKYKLVEIGVPEGYNQLEDEITFTLSASNSTCYYDDDSDAWVVVIAENEQPTAILIVNKTIEKAKEKDTTLIDEIDYTKIKFNLYAEENIINYEDGSIIYNKGTIIGTYSLDSDGKLQIANLPMGKYKLVEIATIDGLVLDSSSKEIYFIKKDNTTKIYYIEQNIVNNTTLFEFSKTDITGNIELVGAKLQVIDEDGNIVDEWISTNKAHKIEGLIVGKTYILHEEVAPNGYVRSTDIKFKVENTNELQKVKMVDKIVEITKSDILGKEVEGATIQVINEDGNIVDEWISTKEPHRINNLIEGKTYTLHEKIAPNGYVIATDIKFTVSTDKSTQKLEMIDKQVSVIKIEDQNNKPLAGAKLQVIDEDGNIVDEWISTEEPHRINNLIEGKTYILHEEVAPDGYVIAADIKFTVSTDKSTQKLEMIDKQVSVIKIEDQNNKPLAGAKLQVIDEDGNIVDEWITDGNKHYISGLIEGHKYIIKEIETPKDYITATPITFIAGNENELQEYTMIDKLDLVTITITKIAKQTSASGKYQKGQSLANCTFTIYDEEGNVLKVVTTDETGSITFNLLRGYKYTIKETQAPEEYLNDSEPQEIYLDDRVTSLSLEFYNNPIILELDISKIGIRQAQPNDIIRYDFPNLINKSNVYLDNFTWKDTLPYEYVKITKLYTGTYNEDLDYKVYYKLNTDSEYKQFGNIYNTLQNNCIDFESLGLDNINTYVTEFKIVFGTVKPGFSAIDTPFIFTKVDDDVTKNDEWINKTKLTGDYTDQFGNKTELSDEDNWKTISYSAKLNVTNKKPTITKLPRTGNELPFIYNIRKISLLIISILGIIIVSKINKKQNLN